MNYVRKLPFILGTGMALIIGIVNYSSDAELKDIYIRMSIGLVCFFILGLYIRGTIYKIDDELRKQREEEESQRKREEYELKMAELERQREEKKEGMNKRNIDYAADEDLGNNVPDGNIESDLEDEEQIYDDEFEPLNVKNVTLKE